MVSCEEFRQSVTDFEVKRRTTELPIDLSTHAAACDECRAYLQEMAQLEEQIRRSARIPVPPGLLMQLRTIPERRRALVAARNRILLPAAGAILAAIAAALVLDGGTLWVSSGFALTGAFAGVAGVARKRLIPD